ncbi:hypothetical protein Glo7428_0638 [Gloeocapsa sp. PCC 7428]|uniref:hypothetical protein n=1 Tax=Gloeocapsa sp. PCC 7428 TaxID=1173026 RepID=UPI0002A5F2AC|nr:hypothetical protein [Gloeocapsa sp. PCC 7428]AFZ29230.1 hypothetical protein Glo7428_0638 [Gloeocapsa sp. PCC 7428]
MELEQYFDFLRADDIRLKAARMGIETILYYLHNQTQMTQYLTEWLGYCAQGEREQDENPSAIVARLKQIKAERSVTAHG